jgi:hypothetical protein
MMDGGERRERGGVAMHANDDGQVLKKVYFIKRAREGEELVTLLKNKFKTIDAIRDVLGWYREGREFAVDLTDQEAAKKKEREQMRFEVTRFTASAENNRSVLGAIGHILNWLDGEKVFDITLIPRDGHGAGPAGAGLN